MIGRPGTRRGFSIFASLFGCSAGPVGAPRSASFLPAPEPEKKLVTWEDPQGFLRPKSPSPKAQIQYMANGNRPANAILTEEAWFEVLGHEMLLPSSTEFKWFSNGLPHTLNVGKFGTLWRDLWLPGGTEISFPLPGFDEDPESATILLKREMKIRGHEFPPNTKISLSRKSVYDLTLSLWPEQEIAVQRIACAANQRLLLDPRGELIAATLARDSMVVFGGKKIPALAGTLFQAPVATSDDGFAPTFSPAEDTDFEWNGTIFPIKKGVPIRFWALEAQAPASPRVKSYTLGRAKAFPKWGVLPIGTAVHMDPEGAIKQIILSEPQVILGQRRDAGAYFLGPDDSLRKFPISRSFE